MDESAALKVIAIRAVETTDGTRAFWSDDDRSWASRAAAEVVGANAPADAFLERRASLALERLGGAHPVLRRTLGAMGWRPWIGSLIVAAAVVIGFFVDQVDRSQRINILAPPVLLLLAWNLVVYALIIAGYIVRFGDDSRDGWLRGGVARLAGGRVPRRLGNGPMRAALIALIADWAGRSAPLQGVRAARILHLSAAALAAGVLAGLYLRGIAFEYLANWQSTFLDAASVHRIAAIAYAPGSWLTHIAVPGVDAVAAIQAPAGANAASWIHLMAATVAALVIVPRLLLAAYSQLIERHRAARLVTTFDEPYFRRLLRGFEGGPSRVRVVPFSYALEADALAGLESIIARLFGAARLMIASTVAYGDEAPLARDGALAPGTVLVAVFNASATPEREVQGAFLSSLARAGGGAEVVAIVDEGAWVARWKAEPSRITDRHAAWERIGEEAAVPVLFASLADPDLAAIEADFERVGRDDD